MQSLRGDLDKPKVAEIAEVPDAVKGDPDYTNDGSTVCPDDAVDNRLNDFDDTKWNDEWSSENWSEDLGPVVDYPLAESGDGAFDCDAWWNKVDARPALVALTSHSKPPAETTYLHACAAHVADMSLCDTWEVLDDKIIRHHRLPRSTAFTPNAVKLPPGIEVHSLHKDRATVVNFMRGAGRIVCQDDWSKSHLAHRTFGERWTGATTFELLCPPGSAEGPTTSSQSVSMLGRSSALHLAPGTLGLPPPASPPSQPGSSVNSQSLQSFGSPPGHSNMATAGSTTCSSTSGPPPALASVSGSSSQSACPVVPPAFAKESLFPVPSSWRGINRVLVEYCTYSDSTLCTDTSHTHGCLLVRCTMKEDMSDRRSIEDLLTFLKAVPRRVCVALWSAIPCTGGSKAQNLNAKRPGHSRKLAEHAECFDALFAHFQLLAEEVKQRGGYVIHEWPQQNRYWNQPVVADYFDDESFEHIVVTGCAFGLRVPSGQYEGMFLEKKWRIASSMPGLGEVLSLPCPKNHRHTGINGSKTGLTGRYPQHMADAFHKHFLVATLARNSAPARPPAKRRSSTSFLPRPLALGCALSCSAAGAAGNEVNVSFDA